MHYLVLSNRWLVLLLLPSLSLFAPWFIWLRKLRSFVICLLTDVAIIVVSLLVRSFDKLKSIIVSKKYIRYIHQHITIHVENTSYFSSSRIRISNSSSILVVCCRSTVVLLLTHSPLARPALDHRITLSLVRDRYPHNDCFTHFLYGWKWKGTRVVAQDEIVVVSIVETRIINRSPHVPRR